MRKRMMITAGLILLMVMATGVSSVHAQSFKDEYRTHFIEMFGEEKYALVSNQFAIGDDPVSRWEKQHYAAIADMPVFPTWEERHREALSGKARPPVVIDENKDVINPAPMYPDWDRPQRDELAGRPAFLPDINQTRTWLRR